MWMRGSDIRMVGLKYNFLLCVSPILFFLGCQTKPLKKELNSGKDQDTLILNAANAIGVKVNHGDSTKVVLSYGGPDVILNLDYFNGHTNSLNISFGENSRVFPEVIMLPPYGPDHASRAYRLNPENGSINEISNSLNNDFDGPYYLFDKDGILIVSGFYKKGCCKGIWRHYNKDGGILEIINADRFDIDVLKHFGVSL